MKRINLGCGFNKIPDCINIDIRKEVEPDLVHDCRSLPYDSGTIDVVLAYDFLEHIQTGQTVDQVTEIWRVLKPGGLLGHRTPSTDGRGAFQDPTHKSYWNLNSWLYFMEDEYLNLYGITAKFIGENRNVWYRDKVCYVEGVLKAVKGED